MTSFETDDPNGL